MYIATCRWRRGTHKCRLIGDRDGSSGLETQCLPQRFSKSGDAGETLLGLFRQSNAKYGIDLRRKLRIKLAWRERLLLKVLVHKILERALKGQSPGKQV